MTDGYRFHTFKPPQTRRRRAVIVCVWCHEKKIKCDLQETSGQGFGKCTNCASIGVSCSIRPSKRCRRERPRRLNEPIAGTQPDSPLDVGEQNQPLTPPQGTEVSDETSSQTQLAPIIPEGGYPGLFDPACMPTSAPENHSTATTEHIATADDAADSYLGEVNYEVVYGSEIRSDADGQRRQAPPSPEKHDLPPRDLQQAFQETFFENCFTWCPVFDYETIQHDLAQSPLVANALGLAASHIKPPVIQHADPATYYDRMKQLFYGDKEPNLLMCLKAISLTYWWSPRPPSRVHRDTSWWWTTVAIRHAQHGGFHREPRPEQMVRSQVDPGLRRRIWWTFFARERLTALCQSRPCVIDPADCTIPPPTIHDFPEHQRGIQAEVFLRWINLCSTIGAIAKHLQRTGPDNIISTPFPIGLARELLTWTHETPMHLRLDFLSATTTNFNRNVHQLHLPYLATVIVLHLSRTPSALPRAYPAAMVAASCIARILRDCLLRGHIRYLMGITCWYCSMALVALLHARQISHLSRAAEADIESVVLTLRELRAMWPTANVFLRGFERLRTITDTEDAISPGEMDDISAAQGIDWRGYFPFASAETSEITGWLLGSGAGGEVMGAEEVGVEELLTFELVDLFGMEGLL